MVVMVVTAVAVQIVVVVVRGVVDVGMVAREVWGMEAMGDRGKRQV